MKHLIILLIFAATLVAWSPNTNPYAVEKTEIDDDIAAKLGITIGDEVSYLESKIISGTERLVQIKIGESRISLTNAKPADQKPALQPVFVTSESNQQKTGYFNSLSIKYDNIEEASQAQLNDELNKLVCYYLEIDDRHIEFWYKPEKLDFLKEKESTPEETSIPKHALVLSPNPANTQFELQLEFGKTQQMNIEIYDSNGNLVKQLLDNYLSVGTNRINCDVNDIQVGMYSVLCICDGQVIGNDRLVIMR